MNSIVLGILMIGLAACGQNLDQVSAVQSTGNGVVVRPSVSVLLQDKNAEALIAIIKAANVPPLKADKRAIWKIGRIDCGQYFLPSDGLQSSCRLSLQSVSTAENSDSQANKPIVLSKNDSKSLIAFLNDVVGVKPLSAIESTTWTTGPVDCSRGGGLSSCAVMLTGKGVEGQPSVGRLLVDKNAEALIAIIKAAKVTPLKADKKAIWKIERIDCSQYFLASDSLQSSCQIRLQPVATTESSNSKANKPIVLSKKASKSLIALLKDVVGVKPLSAIESTTWTTGPVECSRGSGLSICGVSL